VLDTLIPITKWFCSGELLRRDTMMTVGDDKKPTNGTPPIDEIYDAPALAPAEDAPEEPDAAAGPEGEPAPAEETPSGLKTPDEYAPADDGMTEADLEVLGLKASAEVSTKGLDKGIEGKILAIEGGSGDLEEIAGLLVFELDKADVGTAQRKIALTRLVNIHNAEASTEEQRGAVKHLFKRIRTEGSEGLFSQAMVISAKLDDDCEELAEYIKVFAKRVHEDGDGTYKGESHAAFIKSARLMAEKNPSGTKQIIDGLINLWFEKPSTKALWNALMAIADTDSSYPIEAEEGKVDVTMNEAVGKRFMGNYRDLPEEERVEIAGMIVLAMGEEVPKAHVDIIRSMIKRGPDPVRAEILSAVQELDAKDRKGEIEVDRHAMLKVYESLIDQAEDEGCFTENECEDLVESLIESRSRYAYLLDFSASLSAHSLTGLAGQPMDVSTPGVGYNLEWMSSEFSNGMRLLLGAHYNGWVDHHAVGVSVGTAFTSGNFYVKLRAAFDYLYFKGAENGLDDVPVELADPQITADGSAYRMIPHEMDFIMNAATLMLKPEIGYVFHRWHLGGGKTLGIKGFLGLHAGLFAGNVYDDGCSYSYDPAGDDTIHVSPTGGGNAVVVQETDLGTRCRSGEPIFGSIFGAEIGFGLEWGL
jgi:hypothetical protein